MCTCFAESANRRQARLAMGKLKSAYKSRKWDLIGALKRADAAKVGVIPLSTAKQVPWVLLSGSAGCCCYAVANFVPPTMVDHLPVFLLPVPARSWRVRLRCRLRRACARVLPCHGRNVVRLPAVRLQQIVVRTGAGRGCVRSCVRAVMGVCVPYRTRVSNSVVNVVLSSFQRHGSCAGI